jgi:ribosome assembly protein 1
MMGKDVEDLAEVPAGNVFAILGLQSHVLKTATLSTSDACPSLSGIKMEAAPILRVAVEPVDPQQMSKLAEGLKLLNQADGCVQVYLQETGENVIACAGELHLERCLKDLRERFAKIEVQSSDPVVPFRETLSPQRAILPDEEADLSLPTGTIITKIGGTSCTVRIRAIPLPDAVRTFLLESQSMLEDIDRQGEGSKSSFIQSLQKLFEEAVEAGYPLKVDWKSLLSRIVAFGPKRTGTNLLINDIKGCGWKLYLVLTPGGIHWNTAL